MDDGLTLPHLPHLSTLPNLASFGGFVYGVEVAYLGNCLSAFANLVAFSLRTGTPVTYPNLMDHKALFAFSPTACPYAFSPQGNIPGNEPSCVALQQQIEASMSGYFESYMQTFRTVPPEWLSHLGSMSRTTVFLGYRMEFVDWKVYETTMSRFAARGNAVILPGAYWWQYREMPIEAAEVVRKALPIGHCDQQTRRAEQMTDATSGILIGIHVRRGDYENYNGGAYYWDLDVYVSIMHAIKLSLRGQSHLFVLCSNGNWSTEQLDGLNYIYEQGSSYDDFVALSKCHYVVGPPSTYANWASFLGRGKRLVLTPTVIPTLDVCGLENARELEFPTGSGVTGDFWITT